MYLTSKFIIKKHQALERNYAAELVEKGSYNSEIQVASEFISKISTREM